MASHFVRQPKLLPKRCRCTRPHNSSRSSVSAAVLPPNYDQKPGPTSPTLPTIIKPNTILDLSDHKNLFSSLSTLRLWRSSVNLHLATMEPMVDFGISVMNSKLMNVNLVRDVVLKSVRHTFFEQFCAGEDTEEAVRCIKRVKETGLRGMLAYAVEHTSENSACDENMKGFLKTVKAAKSLPPSSVSFVIVKITAICPVNLLKRVSDLLRWEQKDHSYTLPWKRNTFPIFADSSPLYHTLQKPAPLSPEEESDLQLGYQRLQTICQNCVEANVPLTIDAEDTILQPAIDYLTYACAMKYNKDDTPIVYGTIQAYLKDAKDRLLLASNAAEKMGIPMGFKLVRGAYMSSERKLASLLGYESPIHNSIEETHGCFNDCASFMLEKIACSFDAVILATHNVESGEMAAKKARELGIEKVNQKVEFAQLYGMSDALSFGLKNAGFQVSKYMPYGPIEKVMPYLLRRAEENRGMLSASVTDKKLMRKELKRRLKVATTR